jgi:hypothetical protein
MIIQNLLLPNLLKVNESIMGPRKTFKVQGIIVIDNKREISATEAPIDTRKVVKANKVPADRP